MNHNGLPHHTSRNNCCVVGCSNSYITAPAGTKFYSFPNEKFPGRKEKWLAAIRRVGKDGKPWMPTKHSRVCSQHFIGGCKSDHPASPSYIPTLMPKQYRKQGNILQQTESMERFQRSLNRSSVLEKQISPVKTTKQKTEGVNVSVQTEICAPIYRSERTVILFSELTSNCASTQTDLFPANTEEKAAKPVRLTATISTKCGPDVVSHGFEGFSSVRDKDALRGLCGVTWDVFLFILSHLVKACSNKISNENRLMLFLMKIKLGLSFAAIGILFGVHRSTATTHFFLVLDELSQSLSNIVYWPTLTAIKNMLPSSFREYKDVRAIIDCTELRCERPQNPDQQVLMYSNYKGTFTVKYLVSITPNGFISFVSKGYGGRSTDTYITSNCGFLELLVPGDTVMADKGFPLIQSDLQNKSIRLVMPPFATQGKQFSKDEVEETYHIASIRIHVERCIARIKTYHILDKVTVDILPYIDRIFLMCCVLTNLQPPIIKPEQCGRQTCLDPKSVT